MLKLTLIDGQPCWIHPDHIMMIEARPDTLLRLTNGEKWLVRESVDEIREAFIAIKQKMAGNTMPPVRATMEEIKHQNS